MTALLSRYAESIFWLARYMVRAENLARLLEIQETFARDSRGTSDWSIILKINADLERFTEKGASVRSKEVIRFYVTDRKNPTSIAANIYFARENARALRPLISTEMWTHLNIFFNTITKLRAGDITEDKLASVCSMIKEGCQTHTGITDGTFYRDEAWSFYRLGAAIERADQTTRLLDVKFLSFETVPDDPGSAADVSYWTALLRSAACYHAFRRRHPRGMTPEQVAAFMLCDSSFVRSVAASIGESEEALTTLRRHHVLRGTERALEALDSLRDQLEVKKVRALMQNGSMHRFNDHVQYELAKITKLIADRFFGTSA